MSRLTGMALMMALAMPALWAGAALHGPPPATSPSDPSSPYVRGVGLGLFATDPAWDYGPLVDEIRERGATDVLVVVNGFQSNRFSADVALRPGHSPSLQTVARTLAQVRQAGMRAALMPVVRLAERGPGDWRGVITPADGVEAWFAAYGRFMRPLAQLAQTQAAGRFVVGSELNGLEGQDGHWRALIAQLRTNYDGTLLYSANWDRLQQVSFWDALDEVGVTAYFPLLAQGVQATPTSLARAWRGPTAQIEALSRRLGRPVLVTEVGYASQHGAAQHPWDDTASAQVALTLQRQLYDGFCQALTQTPSVSGFYAWNWFGYGGPRDAGYTPRGKPAAAALSTCFKRALETPTAARNDHGSEPRRRDRS